MDMNFHEAVNHDIELIALIGLATGLKSTLNEINKLPWSLLVEVTDY